MKHRANVYGKRVIFDHLQKTAGQAVNKWLRDELGIGSVTDNLGGDHGELIRQYGGEYSIISGHLAFHGADLDPRYQYITLFREPIDRVISYLFFTLKNHNREELYNLYCWTQDFILSNGSKLNNGLLPHISDIYTKHFIAIGNKNTNAVDSEKVERSLSTIKDYDVVGLYEEMPEFLADFAALLGIPAPKSIARVNVTSSRPVVTQISPELRQRIIDLNQLDIRLYNEVVAWKKSQLPEKREPILVSPWQKYEPVRDRAFTTLDIVEMRAELQEDYEVIHGQMITFDVDFMLNRQIHELEAGIHIFDGNRGLAFGTNNTLQGKKYMNVAPGSHRITHHLIANLPAGKYTAGFSLAERLPDGGQQELAWYDVMCEFRVQYEAHPPFAGYVSLPAEITMQPTALADDGLIVQEPVGNIIPGKIPATMRSNEKYKIPVTVSNTGNQIWIGDTFRPVNMSYHWYDQTGNQLPDSFDGLRSPLPPGGIPPGKTLDMEMLVQTPARPGRYCLVLSLVQESVSWFEEKGFQPYKVEVDIA